MLAHKINWLRRSQKKFPADETDRAGNLGEAIALEQLNGILKQLHGQTKIFQSLRVPKHQGSGKYEIDLLLVSQRSILVIEVKHWGGQITKERGSWIQERGSEKKSHPDPVALNQDKLLSLRQWLTQRKFHLPDHCIHSLVLFTNAQVSLGSELKKSAAVMSIPSLLAFTFSKCAQPKRRFWQKKPSFDFDFPTLIDTLEQLPTWDRLHLHGGKILRGDLEYLAIPSVKASAMQRKYLRSASVLISRRLFPGIFLQAKLQVHDWTGRRKVYPLHPDARLVFRSAGQNGKEEFSWLNVESLQLGWKDHSYYDER